VWQLQTEESNGDALSNRCISRRFHLQQPACTTHGTCASSCLQGKRQRQRVDYSLGGGDDGDDEDFSASSGGDSSGGSDNEALTVVRLCHVWS
jgi:hypothetical protein